MNIRTPGLWLTLAALGAVPSGAVFAADMPVKAAPIAPVAYDWSGVYIGVHAGYGGGMKDWTGGLDADFAAKGFLGGGQVGINKQIGSLVFGLELDGSWANISGSQLLSIGGSLVPIAANFNAASKIDGLVTFTGRAGLAADRWFVYAKGGLAVAHATHSFNVSSFDLPPAPASSTVSSASGSEHRWAPTVGFGTEYALGNNWSVKAEYDYIHLGTRTVRLNGTETVNGVAGPVAANVQIEKALHLAKVGVNYRFGGIQTDPSFAPVRAAPGYNWSGAYLGAQGGYGFGRNEWPDFLDPARPEFGKYDVNGWLAGGVVGVNAQAGVFVFGVEGEWMWTGIKGSQTSIIDFGGGATMTEGLESKINWLAIGAARAGFVAIDRLLVYGKAGVALADERHTHTQAVSAPGVGSFALNESAKALHTGVVVGAGAEYALGGNWSAKLEYDYIKMAGQNLTGARTQVINFPPTVGSAISFREFSKMSQDLHLIKFGINYHFNATPVVVSARY